MADVTLRPTEPAGVTGGFGRFWGRFSGRLVPFFAVITALLIGVPFIILTRSGGDIGEGLRIAGIAYSALLEGSTGLALNDRVSPDDFALAQTFTASTELTRRELGPFSRDLIEINTLGTDTVRRYGAILALLPEGLTDDELTELAGRAGDLALIGVDKLTAMTTLVTELEALDRGDVRALAEDFRSADTLGPELRTAVEAAAPSAADLSDDDLLAYMKLVDSEGVVKLFRLIESAAVFEAAGIAPGSPEADDLAAIAALEVPKVREYIDAVARVDAAGVLDLVTLSNQLAVTKSLYDADLLENETVAEALAAEVPVVADQNLLVLRSGNRLVVGPGTSPVGVINADYFNTPDDATDDRAEVYYMRLGNSALLFFPSNLEAMIVRSLPFIIAGLAVSVGFMAGLFNVGAEGQLYIGGALAAWVGFSPIFSGLPAVIHLPLVIIAGIIGGTLWATIPGVLKAYTGAHEVINTIMLNFVAVLLVDWLIKSENPIILLDPTASTPRTPFIAETARIPGLDDVAPVLYVVAGLIVFGFGLWKRRKALSSNPQIAIRPLVNGVLVTLVGLFLSAMTVRGNLHLGILLALFAVWFADWFLVRTTLGFEIRTVGANPNAARYAGMSVSRNIVLAMALSGALVGLASVNEIAGVQYGMQPGFFSGLGFDAIAVALLARKRPSNMIAAGLLWGALLTGAGLMQIRADISIDLVKIIQALIIMFIAADAIIRYLWRVSKTAPRDVTTFSRGWGS